jgi:hypothetical protein
LRGASLLLLSTPSPPFPPSHLSIGVGVGVGVVEVLCSEVLRSDAGASVGWDVGRGGVGCDAEAGTGATSRQVPRPDVRAVALPIFGFYKGASPLATHSLLQNVISVGIFYVTGLGGPPQKINCEN